MHKLASSYCANCKKDHRNCNLKRCSGCSLHYYCSEDCQKAHWKTHKVECKQIQATRKSAKERDALKLNTGNPFEGAIAAFETEVFTDDSFLDFIEMIKSIYFIDERAGKIRENLEGVTMTGYARLIALAVRALNEYPYNPDVDFAASDVFISFGVKYCTPATAYSGLDVLYNASASKSIMCMLQKHPAEPEIARSSWYILSRMARTERTKYLEALGSVGIIDAATEALKGHGRDEQISMHVLQTLATWLLRLNIRGLTVPPYDSKALLLNIMLAMKRYSSHADILSSSCMALNGMLSAFGRKIEALQGSPVAASMASMGVYELVVTTMQRFPAERHVAQQGSQVLGYLSKLYFADQSKPRNTDAGVAIAWCLLHHGTGYEASNIIIAALYKICSECGASGAKFLLSEVGIRSLGAALQAHVTDEELVYYCSMAVSYSCESIKSMSKSEYLQVISELERHILPALVQGLKQHLHCVNVGIVGHIMSGLVNILLRTENEYPEVAELFREAMRLHPGDTDVQTYGGDYLMSI